jgi:hypothetical protein
MVRQSLEALGVPYAALKRPEWALVVAAIATIALIAWESWVFHRNQQGVDDGRSDL